MCAGILSPEPRWTNTSSAHGAVVERTLKVLDEYDMSMLFPPFIQRRSRYPTNMTSLRVNSVHKLYSSKPA